MPDFQFYFELIGAVAFAVSGAALAVKKGMDLFGVAVMGMTTAVGGGIPWLTNLEKAARANHISRVWGILNGTTNYIMDAMHGSDVDFADVLAQAQALGYAEADPSADIDGLDIIPSHIDLVGAEIEMLNLANREKVLKNLLDPIRSDYDYILIDCSPSLGLITVNSLTAADSVIIPVQCEYFALEGISKLLNTIKIIKNKLNTRLEIEGFLLTMYDSRLRLANQIYDEVKRHFQELVFKTVIQRNVKLSESPSHGLPVILYDADSTGSKNHLALAKEIINKNSKDEEHQ